MEDGDLAGDWSKMEGKVRQQWGKLTEEDLSASGGDRDALLARLRERYGLSEDEARRQWDEWSAEKPG